MQHPRGSDETLPSIHHQRSALSANLRRILAQVSAGELDGARVVVEHQRRVLLDLRTRDEREEQVSRLTLRLLALMAKRPGDPAQALEAILQAGGELAQALGFRRPEEVLETLQVWEQERQG